MSDLSTCIRFRIPWPNPSARPRAGQNEDCTLPESNNVDHTELANAIRALSMDAVQAANSGHPGMPMGAADMATILFTKYLKYDPADPDWFDRDRFVLSAGHGSMLLYSLLYLTGYPDISIEQIKNFRQWGSKTAGHPEYGEAGGIEMTTGPLGQGIASAVGMAIAERSMNSRYGDSLVDHRTWVIASDGDLMEGISHEAGSLAGHMKLGRLIVLYDDNGISIDGSTDISLSDDALGRFEAYGWHAQRCNGHSPNELSDAIDAALSSGHPSIIACRTTIGYGAPTKAGTSGSHGAPLGDEEIASTREALNWPHDPFVVPSEIISAWRVAGARGAKVRNEWNERLINSDRRQEFERAVAGDLPAAYEQSVITAKKAFSDDAPKLATRASSGKTLDHISPAVPEMIGGSADLTGSNNTKADGFMGLLPPDYSGRYLYYGVREHGMAAAMNGMALHGGVIPYSGTFLIFSDYLRPSLRLAALMGVRAIHVLTHDSIGLGEDGPTHQPVEHLAALRSIPNVNVFRPADAVEVVECWQLALENKGGPSVLALTRQGLPTLRTDHTDENLSAKGAYVLAEAEGERAATILATGSEVEIAMAARDMLQLDGVPTAVVSMPCWELFSVQDNAYRTAVLGDAVRVAVEAAIKFGWEQWIGPDGGFVGMKSFGASAPASTLYDKFGITAQAVVATVKERL
ncbi:MAG: Transketolase [Alphaproteobacteria bacterium MarineAlpha11_Bin1]|nr:MAG: Transketolase [Alphaproteobacteria bacterium MarineAlpha11_Bin1]|tara:strand:+ start:6183 stop:8252 length:2070 start_codon:yes stop_codon:yes gene_type:complete